MTVADHRRSLGDDEPIAIVGMAGLFPKAPDKDTFWRNILDGVDAVTDAPADWHGELFLDPASHANDRVYTTRGGFLGDLASFDPLRHGVMPSAIDGGEPDQFLALEMAANAVEDAGLALRPVPGDRIAVILGRGTYINRGFTSVVQHGVMVDRFMAILRQLHPDTTAAEIADVKAQLKASLPPFNAEIAPALVPNLVTGRIANRLDFRGASYIIDAACASSLIALERGMADLRAGRCDMAMVGGVHASTPAPIYMIFCQLEALSRKGAIKPFSAEADGTLLGEGVGILCLKRLTDAETAGDRIYALVRGVGVASDGKGLGILAPRIEGQALALHRAYAESGVDPGSVGLIEAHGTATKLGDATEVEALTGQFGARVGSAPTCALGAVKSMIGHCLPASGSAGLIKTALALYHRTLPPTLVETPNPALGLEQTPFYLNTEARPWIHGAASPRRAGVNAFGFGGINAHAVLEEYRGAPEPRPVLTRSTEVLMFDAADAGGLGARLDATAEALRADVTLARLATQTNAALGQGGWRAAIVASDRHDAQAKLARLTAQLAAGKTRLRDRKGIYLTAEPLAFGGKLAFMYPGEGSQHIGMLREVMLHRPEMRAWFDLVDGAFAGHGRGLLPSQVIFPPPDPHPGSPVAGESLWRMDIGPEAIFAANQAVGALYAALGIKPDMVVGHSTGEYSALYAAGVTRRDSPARLQAEMRELNGAYEMMASEGIIAGGTLIAVGAVPNEALAARLAERSDVVLAMDNCPNQKVIATFTPEARDWVVRTTAALGGFSEVLPFERAYHSPAFAGFSARLHLFLQGIAIAPPALPVYSCLTTQPFPADPKAIRRLTADQWSGQVRFAETIAQMHADGARVFLECGPRNNLTAFVNDILRGKPHHALAVDTPGRTGLEQMHHMLAQLAVEGVTLDVAAFAAPSDEPPLRRGPSRPQILKMGIQPMALRQVPVRPDRAVAASPAPLVTTAAVLAPAPAVVAAPIADSEPAPGGVVAAYFDMMERFVASEGDIMSAYLANAAPAALMPPGGGALRFPLLASRTPAADGNSLTANVVFDLDQTPFLRDHSFGRAISGLDPDLGGLAVVPLTFSIEVLAECAAALRPALVVTALREVRASRWLALDRPALTLEVTAEMRHDGGARADDPTVIRVRLREADGPTLRPILVEAEVELATARPAAPLAEPLEFSGVRPAQWSQADIYQRIMFHGPLLQAVASLDLAAENGCEGTLVGVAQDHLLAGTAAPAFETDAVTLDAVGQLVGVWAAEMLPEAFHIFPFRVERIALYRDPLGPGETARCRCRIALSGSDEMRSTVDVVSGDGRLQCRIEGWWDKRFALPDRFFRARLDPAANPIARPLALPPGAAAPPPGLALALVEDLSTNLLEGSGQIWQKVLAGLVLSQAERADLAALATAQPKRRDEWLRGRVAAKGAVRMLTNRSLRPADIGITAPQPDGGPQIGPLWPTAWGAAPLISISHKGELALAAAADPAIYAGVGVDLERVAPRDGAFLAAAFSDAERAAIAALPEPAARDALATRLWCAKEAVAKSFGAGLAQLDRFEALPQDAGTNRVVVHDRLGDVRIFVDMTTVIDENVLAAVALRPLRH